MKLGANYFADDDSMTMLKERFPGTDLEEILKAILDAQKEGRATTVINGEKISVEGIHINIAFAD